MPTKDTAILLAQRMLRLDELTGRAYRALIERIHDGEDAYAYYGAASSEATKRPYVWANEQRYTAAEWVAYCDEQYRAECAAQDAAYEEA